MVPLTGERTPRPLVDASPGDRDDEPLALVARDAGSRHRRAELPTSHATDLRLRPLIDSLRSVRSRYRGIVGAGLGIEPLPNVLLEVTVNVVEPDTPSVLAPICVTPGDDVVTTPRVEGVFDTVPIGMLLELHVARCVTSRVEPSEKNPVAVNCFVKCAGKLAPGGLISIVVSVALVTTMSAPHDTPGNAAVMPATAPAETPVTTPLAPAAFETVATAGLLELHTARSVTSTDDPSESVAVAVSCPP